MKRLGMMTAFLGLSLLASPAMAQKQVVVGVSWSNFQEERWKTDEAAIKAQLDKLGAYLISAHDPAAWGRPDSLESWHGRDADRG